MGRTRLVCTGLKIKITDHFRTECAALPAYSAVWAGRPDTEALRAADANSDTLREMIEPHIAHSNSIDGACLMHRWIPDYDET